VLLSLVYVWGPQQYQAFEGRCEGSVVHPDSYPITAKGFYDVLFVPENSGKTYAELDLAGADAQYSYRIRALKQFLSWYATHSSDTVQEKQQSPVLES
ncbi:MAG: non-canonical purine NTP pyrophosphatase, partial [Candidatus Babeliales bacterium]|nr:non-canonical purine NTP pyrophosphatase [Candidatus Babeliales bacterium]